MKKIYSEKRFSSFRELIDSCAQNYKSKTAFRVKHRENEYEDISFTTFKEEYYRLCSELLSRGLSGARIAVIGKNAYEWILSYLAAATVGVAVPLDKELGNEDIESFLSAANCRLVCSDRECISKIGEAYEILSFSEIRKIAGQENAIDESAVKARVLRGDEMQILIFTSGTTGRSKGVCLSQKNVCANIHSTVSMVKLLTTDRVLSILPLHHTYECTLDHLTVLSKGGCITYAESLVKIAKNIGEYSPTILVVVPELLKTLARRIKSSIAKDCPKKYQALFHDLTLSEALKKTPFLIRTVIKHKVRKTLGGKLRLFIVGAADLDTALVDDFAALGIRTLQGYGLTECAPLLAGNNDFYFNPKSTGIAIPFVELKIDAPNSDGVGEILAKGENIMLGYYCDEQATKAVMHDGWFCTGDLGRMDPDGALYITGRKKNIIVTENGKNIYPEELETRIAEFSEVSDVIVVADRTDGKIRIKAKIFPSLDFLREKLGHEPSAEEKERAIHRVIDLVNGKIPSYKHVHVVEVLTEALEKTTTRKIKRFGTNLT
ncbi:MAG: AMP-binding protein [Clostridia bacterium]|nr:AMP-binding protein [Clostridia bacterium]